MALNNIDNVEEGYYENLTDSSVEDIAKFLYMKDPTEHNKIVLFPFMPSETNTPMENHEICSYIFEMLINLYLEGVMHTIKLFKMRYTEISESEMEKFLEDIENEKYEVLDYKNMSANHLEFFNKWFTKLGFVIRVEQYNIKEYKELHNDHFCKIILKNDPEYTGFFIYKNINKPFHFLVNPLFNKKEKLEDIWAIFIRPYCETYDSEQKSFDSEQEQVFRISFKKI